MWQLTANANYVTHKEGNFSQTLRFGYRFGSPRPMFASVPIIHRCTRTSSAVHRAPLPFLHCWRLVFRSIAWLGAETTMRSDRMVRLETKCRSGFLFRLVNPARLPSDEDGIYQPSWSKVGGKLKASSKLSVDSAFICMKLWARVTVVTR